MDKAHCKNKIIIVLANKLDRGFGHYVTINLERNRFGFCRECHKFSLIGRKDKICSSCYYRGLEEATCMNWGD